MRILRSYGKAIGLLTPEWRLVAALFAGNLLNASLQFTAPMLFGHVITSLSTSKPGSGNLFQDGGFAITAWMATQIASVTCGAVVSLHADRLAHRLRLDALARFHDHVLSLPPAFHAKNHSGETMRIMMSGISALFNFWLGALREHVNTLLAVIVMLPITLVLNWRLAISLLCAIILACCISGFVADRTSSRQQSAEKTHNKLAGNIHDSIGNVAVVDLFGMRPREGTRRGTFIAEVIRDQYPVLGWWAFANVMGRMTNSITILCILLEGAYLHAHGHAQVGEIIAFVWLAGNLIGRLESSIWFTERLFADAPSLDTFFDVLATKPTVEERPQAADLAVTEGRVDFDNISFAYADGPPILSRLSFSARRGQVVALVGRTGAGKTTAMSLLQRSWDPIEGAIRIDGVDIRDVTVDSLHHAIGIVFQDSLLFNRTIRENLLAARPDASDADLEYACRAAEAHEFITRKPEGYDTMVGERGSTLSGGQKQRIAIARLILKDAPILILDEATSALDAATEAKITRALRKLMVGRTTFVVAHRLSTIMQADQVLVFEDGRIVERGPPEELLRLEGAFSRLAHGQQGTVAA